MQREIVKDPLFLSQKSEPATRADLQIVTDLIDTLKANIERCVGLAANMIGEKKRILMALDGNDFLVMINPKIIDVSKQFYETAEGCLSLSGERNVKRYESIVVEYQDKKFKKRKKIFKGHVAQIIQHEMDHFEGILI